MKRSYFTRHHPSSIDESDSNKHSDGESSVCLQLDYRLNYGSLRRVDFADQNMFHDATAEPTIGFGDESVDETALSSIIHQKLDIRLPHNGFHLLS
jgi:hypothetical protein